MKNVDMPLSVTADPLPAKRSAVVSWTSDRVFYTRMSVAEFATVFVGFARPYYLSSYTGAPSFEIRRAP